MFFEPERMFDADRNKVGLIAVTESTDEGCPLFSGLPSDGGQSGDAVRHPYRKPWPVYCSQRPSELDRNGNNAVIVVQSCVFGDVFWRMRRLVTVAPTAPAISMASHARCAITTVARRPFDAPAVA